ncbi:unnamed protein product [Meganyctiphanes norvegica]|uniref:Uncharacterized protein n=1 Tax=Meganyctiphanes norvegica TaxID=48144 RepID=A0AAV2QVM1_MEGNR
MIDPKFLWFASETNALYRIRERGQENFYNGKDTFYNHGLGFAVTSGAPFKHNFDKIILQLIESGLVDKWKQEELNKAPKPRVKDTDSIFAINIEMSQAAFFILIMGFTVAAIVLIIEIITGQLEKK